MKRHIDIIFVLLLFLFVSCKKQPEGVLSENRMVDLLVDVHKSEAVMALNYNKFSNDEKKRAVREAVFMRHNTTQAEFDSSLVWYGNHIDKYMGVYDRVIERLNKENEEVKLLIAQDNSQILTRQGDTVDIWKQERDYIFDARKGENLLTFDITTDENFARNDRFLLNIHTINPPANGDKAHVYLAIRHNKQNIHYNYATIENSGWTTLKIQSDSVTDLSVIYGYILLPQRYDRHVMYVDSIELIRIHEKKGMPVFPYRIMETNPDRMPKKADKENKPTSARPQIIKKEVNLKPQNKK